MITENIIAITPKAINKVNMTDLLDNISLVFLRNPPLLEPREFELTELLELLFILFIL